MIIVITCQEKDKKTGWIKEVVSHGYDTVTCRDVVLPQDDPMSMGCSWNKSMGEWVLGGSSIDHSRV